MQLKRERCNTTNTRKHNAHIREHKVYLRKLGVVQKLSRGHAYVCLLMRECVYICVYMQKR